MKTSLHHAFDPYIAQEYGLHESILIHHFQYWIQLNSETNKNFHDGRYWTYQTLENIAAHFPYFSRDQVNRTIRSLVDQKIIIKGNYNKTQFDRTVWYAFENQEDFIKTKKCLRNGENAKSDMAKSPNPNVEIATPIPDTKTNDKKNNKQASPEPAAAVVVFSCLKDNKNVPQKQKEKLSDGRFTEDEVKHGISFTEAPQTIINTSYIQTLWWACKTQPELPKAVDPDSNKNTAIQKIKPLEKSEENWEINVLGKYVEICPIIEKRRDSTGRVWSMRRGNPVFFSYEKKSFWNELIEFVKGKIPTLYQKLECV